MISEVSFCGATEIEPRSLNKSPIRCAASVNLRETVWIGTADGQLIELDSATGSVEKKLPCSSSTSGAVNFLVVFTERVAVGFGRGVVLVNYEGVVVQSLTAAEVQGAICGAAVSECLFVGGICGKVAVWDLSDELQPCFARSLAAHKAAVTCIAVPPVAKSNWFIATGSATGEIAVWTESRERSVILHTSVPATALLFVADDAQQLSLWCGFGDGTIRVWRATDGDANGRHFHAHASGVTSLVRNAGEHKVWSSGVDGTAACWDVVSSHEVLRLRHSGELVGVIPISRASVWRLWVLSMQGGLQSYVSHASEINGTDDDKEDGMRDVADAALEQVRQQHGEIQRLSSALSACRATSCRSTSVESEETFYRRLVLDLWKETTQTAFVSFLVSRKSLETAHDELSAVREERDYFKGLLSSTTQTQREPERHDAASSPVRVISDVLVSAQVAERDHQIRMLQNELVHQRRIAMEAIHNSDSESTAQLRALQQALETEKCSKAALSSELLRLECRLDEVTRECESIREKAEKSAAASDQRARSLVKASQRAAELEVAELGLSLQQQREAHLQETQRLSRELLAMKKPWESMKKALADAHAALEHSRAEFRAETSSMENIIRQQAYELDSFRTRGYREMH